MPYRSPAEGGGTVQNRQSAVIKNAKDKPT